MKRFSQVIAQVAWLVTLVPVLGGSLHAASPTPDTDIIPFGSSWRYFNPQTLNQDPSNNLELIDFDFKWFLPNYDEADLTVDDGGPVTLSWQGPASSPIGYGAIVGFSNGFATNIGQPASGERYTVRLMLGTSINWDNVGITTTMRGVMVTLTSTASSTHRISTNWDSVGSCRFRMRRPPCPSHLR